MARPRQFDERETLLKARQRFWHQGYEATSMADLVEATGVASQSLYGAFGSKHEFFVRTLEDYCTSQVAGLAASEEACEERAASAWAWLMAAVGFDDGGRLGLGDDGCYLAGSVAALARTDEAVHAASKRTYDGILAIFRLALDRAGALGELKPDIDREQVAYALLTAMQGVEFLRKAGLTEEQFAEAKGAAVAALTAAYARIGPGDLSGPRVTRGR